MIPKAREDDPEDVSWALSTAATSLSRGDRVEALKWLRRAAEAASEAEHDERALELAKAAADLSVAPPPPVTKPAPPVTTPAPATTPKAPAATAKPRLQQPKTRQIHSLATTKKMTREQTKLPPLESEKKKGAPSEEHTDTQIEKIIVPPVVPAHEADAWPTEAMGASDLDSLHEVYGAERTRIGGVAYDASAPPPADSQRALEPEFRASQAVRVIVWRDGDGELRVAPFGTSVSAVTIEALLVAPSPDVDLLAWLSPS
jgi:hypothetical protein